MTATRLDPPQGVEGVVVIPGEQVPTEEARKAIPDQVPLTDAVANISAASELVLGIQRSDLTLIGRGLSDRLHQPHRAHLYPRSMEIVQEAPRMGAIGATISGAGPSVLVWTFWQSTGEVMKKLTRGWGTGRRCAGSRSRRWARTCPSCDLTERQLPLALVGGLLSLDRLQRLGALDRISRLVRLDRVDRLGRLGFLRRLGGFGRFGDVLRFRRLDPLVAGAGLDHGGP